MSDFLISNRLFAFLSLSGGGRSSQRGQSIPVESISLTFSLNRIPQAVVSLGLGRSLRSRQPAQDYQLLREAYQKQKEIDIFLRVEGDWSSAGGNWGAAGQQRIFRGRCVGLNYSRTTNQIALVLHLVHWLSDLSFGCLISDQTHPQNPLDLSFEAVYDLPGAGGNFQGQPAFVHTASGRVTAAGIQEDVWGEAILPAFLTLAAEDQVRVGGADSCGGLASSNRQSLMVLQKLEASLQHADYRPLSIELEAAAEGVAYAIRTYILRCLAEAYWQTNFWDLLVGEFCPKLFMQVVPCVDHALITPACPTSQQIYKEITADELSSLNPVLFQQRPLRGVGIWTSVSSETNYAGNNPESIRIGGCWLPDDQRMGMVRYLPAPEWLHYVPLVTQDPRKSLPKGSNPIGTATTPRGAAPDKNPPMSTVRNSAGRLADRIAQQYFGLEYLQGRSLVCSGKLRFDIAPGSLIAVSSISPIPGADRLIGLVEQVSIDISCAARQATTTFHLSHVRTEEENNADDGPAMAAHPLYQHTFAGTPLVEAFNFD